MYLLESSVIIAGEEHFTLQRDRSCSFSWYSYGFKLQYPQGAVSMNTEVAVTALAGGDFKLPKGTELVSAVYAISISKPLLKPLVIKLQHCVDLRKNSQIGYMKFVRASLKSPNAYQFSIVEGGVFSIGNRYGSIERSEFCAFGIVAEMGNGHTPNGGGGNGSSLESDTQTHGIINFVLIPLMCLYNIGTSNASQDQTNGDTPNDSEDEAGENSEEASLLTITTPPKGMLYVYHVLYGMIIMISIKK